MFRYFEPFSEESVNYLYQCYEAAKEKVGASINNWVAPREPEELAPLLTTPPIKEKIPSQLNAIRERHEERKKALVEQSSASNQQQIAAALFLILRGTNANADMQSSLDEINNRLAMRLTELNKQIKVAKGSCCCFWRRHPEELLAQQAQLIEMLKPKNLVELIALFAGQPALLEEWYNQIKLSYQHAENDRELSNYMTFSQV